MRTLVRGTDASDAVATVLSRCHRGLLVEDGMAVGGWVAMPTAWSPLPRGPDGHVVEAVRLRGEGGAAACRVPVDLAGLDPPMVPRAVRAAVRAAMARSRRIDDTTAHSALRDLGVLPTLDGPPRRCAVAIPLVTAVMRAVPGSGRGDWDALAADHLSAVTGPLSALLGHALVDVCATLDRTLSGYSLSSWVDDDLWPSLLAPGSDLVRALVTLPQHADVCIHAALRDPASLRHADSATLLMDASRACGVAGLPRWAATWSTGASEALLALSSPAHECDPDLTELVAPLVRAPPSTRATRLLLRLARLPASWLPGPGEVDACHEALQASLAILAAMGADRRPTHVALGAKGRWPEFLGRVVQACGGAASRARLEAEDMGDVAEALAVQLLLPACALSGTPPPSRDDAMESARRLLYGSCGMFGALARSRAWHAGLARADSALADLSPTLATSRNWAAGLPDHVDGDVSLVVLTGAGALADEGRAGGNPDGTEGLSHCSGGYAARCEAGRVRVVSLRRTVPDGAFERLSTAEVRPVHAEGGARFEVVQHRGRRNAEPDPACVAALDRYVAALTDGRLAADLSAFRPDRRVPDAVRAAGYDFRVPGAFAEVVRIWSDILPRSARGWGHRGFAAFATGAEAGVPACGTP